MFYGFRTTFLPFRHVLEGLQVLLMVFLDTTIPFTHKTSVLASALSISFRKVSKSCVNPAVDAILETDDPLHNVLIVSSG